MIGETAKRQPQRCARHASAERLATPQPAQSSAPAVSSFAVGPTPWLGYLKGNACKASRRSARFSEPGGFKDSSRGLSPATPPDFRNKCLDPGGVAETPSSRVAIIVRPLRGQPGWHYTGGIAGARPPATIWEPSGFLGIDFLTGIALKGRARVCLEDSGHGRSHAKPRRRRVASFSCRVVPRRRGMLICLENKGAASGKPGGFLEISRGYHPRNLQKQAIHPGRGGGFLATFQHPCRGVYHLNLIPGGGTPGGNCHGLTLEGSHTTSALLSRNPLPPLQGEKLFFAMSGGIAGSTPGYYL